MEALHDVVKAGKARYVGSLGPAEARSGLPSLVRLIRATSSMVEALDLQLTNGELEALETHYTLREPAGFH